MQSRESGGVLMHLAEPLTPFLARADVLEVVMNRPGEVWVEDRNGWTRHEVPAMDYSRCWALARAVGSYCTQDINDSHPLLSATLPGGQRAQFVIPSATNRGTVSITIRKPAAVVPRLEDLEAGGLFSRVVQAKSELQQHQHELLELKNAGRWAEFLRRAVQLRQTIVISGQTGSGKTHIMKALAEEFGPLTRIVSIESVAEVLLPNHPLAAHLFYSDTGQGLATVTPAQLLECSLRMRPDVILLAEVRGPECYFFVRAAATGHPGSMTTLHAGSCAEAFEQMTLMIRQSPGGAGLEFSEIKRLLTLTVDVVVQFGNDGSGRHIREVYYDPARKLTLSQEATR
jgi:type IV secretion system protein VirB11